MLSLPRIKTDYAKFTCPVKNTIDIIGDKWTLFILRELYYGKEKQGFNELLGYLKPISSRTLAKKLHHLQKYNIISRKIVREKPLKVEYRLTKKGLKLKNVLQEFAKWYKSIE